jgi:hypothetical protein
MTKVGLGIMFAIMAIALLWKPDFLSTDSLGGKEHLDVDLGLYQRLERALRTRSQAENVPHGVTRAATVMVLAMALLTALRLIPTSLLVATVQTAFSITLLAKYLYVRRKNTSRFATLRSRNIFGVLPAPTIAAVTLGTLSAAIVGFDVHYRVSAIVTVVWSSVLIWIAWRIADAPALLMGEDPTLEAVVDDGLRNQRADAAVVAAACVSWGYVSTANGPGSMSWEVGLLIGALILFGVGWILRARRNARWREELLSLRTPAR